MAALDNCYDNDIVTALEATPSCGLCQADGMRCEECVAEAKDGLTRTEIQWGWGKDNDWFGILTKANTARHITEAGYDGDDADKVWDYLLKEVPLMPSEDDKHRTFTQEWVKEQHRQANSWIRHALEEAGCEGLNLSHPLAGSIITNAIVGYAISRAF